MATDDYSNAMIYFLRSLMAAGIVEGVNPFALHVEVSGLVPARMRPKVVQQETLSQLHKSAELCAIGYANRPIDASNAREDYAGAMLYFLRSLVSVGAVKGFVSTALGVEVPDTTPAEDWDRVEGEIAKDKIHRAASVCALDYSINPNAEYSLRPSKGL